MFLWQCRIHSGQCLRLLSIAMLWGLFTTSSAVAQITVQNVIGNAVADAGPKYAEVQSAIDRFTHNDPAAARLDLEAAKKKFPQLAPPEVMMAELWQVANQPNNERAELENCVKNYPADPEAYLILADFSFAEGRTAAAEALFDRAAQLTTNFTENARRKHDFQYRITAGLAAVAERRAQWEQAKRYLESWLALDPDSAPAHTRLGRVLFRADPSSAKNAGARQAYEQFQIAAKADDKAISPDLALGLLFEESKLHDQAQKFIARAVTNLPKNPAAQLSTLFAAGQWALDTGEYQAAADYADLALKLNSKSLDAKFLKGIAARMLGDVKTAERSFEEITAAAPENFPASNQLAQVLAEQNDREKRDRALQLATINQRMHGQDRQNAAQAIESAATLGWVYYQMQRTAEATQALQTVANSGAPGPDSLYFMARLIQDRGDSAGALNLLNAALANSHWFVHRKEATELRSRLANQAAAPKGASDAPRPGGSQPPALLPK